ncbi:MAG: stage II sporulation protein M [Anaerolineales bacterium]|nr:MAG: stage II sporulation protein M [Anaerolineales bacterium]
MRRNWDAVWMVARREFIDQFRDWRIIVPMVLLVSLFPFAADDTTRRAIDFANRNGGDLILERLIPFMVLVIGFFPLSFSLVVALESFVGEKERGTIEPLLSSPLEDQHLYLGKLLVGITTPLVFSYASIGMYLLLMSRRTIELPDLYILSLVLMLTFGHAVLMVSSAIIISVQATTIRAANLLASFVVAPVAFLLQGETALIFWGDEEVLWYAIAAVTLLSALIVRLGLSHFRREYLLGREIDTLNVKHLVRVFTDQFSGKANGILDWYRRVLPQTLSQLKKPLLIVAVVGVAVIFVSYWWVITQVPEFIALTPDRADRIRTYLAGNLTLLEDLSSQLPAPVLFYHNARATLIIFILGMVSFGTLGVAFFIGNIGLVGGVLGGAAIIGFSPVLTFVAGVLPHGIFELTAFFLATAAMLKSGAQLVTPQPEKSLSEILMISIADWFRVFIGIVLPLLAIAAVIEVYVTPILIRIAFGTL